MIERDGFERRSSSFSRSRSGSVSSDRSQDDFNEGLLDSINPRASFSFKAWQIEEKQSQEEDKKFRSYQVRFKIVSLFFVVLSTLVLINACIGSSSAPFYDKHTECNIYELTDECSKLKKWASSLYGFEVIGSLILCLHGLLGMAVVEHTRKICLIKTLNYYTKIALIFYFGDVLLRTAIYLKVLDLVGDVELDDEESEDFGDYLAIYIDNHKASIIVTSVLIGVYCTCFLSNCYMIYLTSRLEKEATQVMKAKEEA